MARRSTGKRLHMLLSRSYSSSGTKGLPREHEFAIAPSLVARCPKSDQPLQHLSCPHHSASPATTSLPSTHSSIKSSHRKTQRRWDQQNSIFIPDSRSCTKVFASQRALERHLERHSSHKFVCDTCLRRFTEPWSLHKHTVEQHGYDYSRRLVADLRQQASMSEDEAGPKPVRDIDSSDSLVQSRLLSCPECNDEFLTAKSLADHVAREGAEHSSKRPRVTFKCAADLQNVFVRQRAVISNSIFHSTSFESARQIFASSPPVVSAGRFSERSHDGLATRSGNAPRAAYFSLRTDDGKIPTMHFHPLSAEPGELVTSLFLNLNSFAQTPGEYKLYLVECMPQNTSSERASMRVTVSFAREDAWQWCESQNLLKLDMRSNPILSMHREGLSSSTPKDTELSRSSATSSGKWSAASRFYTRALGWRHVRLVVSVANGAEFAAPTSPKWLDGAHVFTENGRTFCPYCDGDFHPYEDLFQHHSESSGHICGFTKCGKQYGSAHALAIHERSHMGDRAFKCSFCNLGFWDPAARFAHERVHEDERHTYDCQMCSKSFQNLSGLFNHKWVHMGKIDYVCPDADCSGVFGHPEALRHHISSVHGHTPDARRVAQHV